MGQAIYVDFDGVLACHSTWKGHEHTGEPVPKMVDLVKRLHAAGKTVKIFTARVSQAESFSEFTDLAQPIEDWCKKHLGFVPEITATKGMDMVALLDDRAISVKKNMGTVAGFDLSAIEDGLDD